MTLCRQFVPGPKIRVGPGFESAPCTVAQESHTSRDSLEEALCNRVWVRRKRFFADRFGLEQFFHMVIARVNAKGRFTFIDRRKEYVRLAGGCCPTAPSSPKPALGHWNVFPASRTDSVPFPNAIFGWLQPTRSEKQKIPVFSGKPRSALVEPSTWYPVWRKPAWCIEVLDTSNRDEGKRLVVDIGGEVPSSF